MTSRTAAIGIVGAAVAAAVWLAQPPARAEVRRTTPQQAFSSGAMRSEQVLREIAATLRTIDSRLARVEATLQRREAAGGAGAR